MINNDVSTLTIVVARPGEAGETLCTDITARFGRALHVPAIGFAPPDDLEAFQAAIDIIDQIAKDDVLNEIYLAKA